MYPLSVMIDAVRPAGQKLLRLQKTKLMVKKKGPGDTCSNADRASQEMLVRALRKAFPRTPVISEEMESCPLAFKKTRFFVVDPLDGSKNFEEGSPNWGVTIAYIQHGQPSAGVIYLPRQKLLMTAARGRGCCINGKRIKFTDQRTLADTIVGTEFTPRIKRAKVFCSLHVPIALQSAGLQSTLSAVVSIMAMLQGYTGAYFNIYGRDEKVGTDIWNYAAGAIGVLEAGGVVLGPNGRPPRWDQQKINIVLAESHSLAKELLSAMKV